MIFAPEKDTALTAELRALRAAGGVPILLLIHEGEPVTVGLDGDELVILPPERVTFDAAVGYRIEPEGNS
ncbi:hypothetical protein [Microbacterium sp. H6]|uniref:hypothetical protein n=1 Tax=Microbacterium sp. H6 TaxID=421122 RepID=UPI000DE51C8C|nr:hypothetical protein [Microbacterium sp. H6]RBO73045.1 hypothetical protein DSP71_07325 [Microbacterium sp. H6]